jgi:hypothetical protein
MFSNSSKLVDSPSTTSTAAFLSWAIAEKQHKNAKRNAIDFTFIIGLIKIHWSTCSFAGIGANVRPTAVKSTWQQAVKVR